ncbi:MAG: hypothetical protein ACT4P6_07025 [Gemmatimonadaceae bacterium]
MTKAAFAIAPFRVIFGTPGLSISALLNRRLHRLTTALLDVLSVARPSREIAAVRLASYRIAPNKGDRRNADAVR